MNKYAKLIFVLAALMLLMLFLFPMWRITLLAPQYPDGLYMDLWIYKLTGDVSNLNIMNHYVGMQLIHAEDFKEFIYFPWVVAGLSLTGILAGISGNRKIMLAWILLVVILGALGIYDFYLWEYKYGHNLNPSAPIKVPGMAYQPPLFGRKELLNFIAYSYPAFGGISIGISIFLASLAWLITGKNKIALFIFKQKN